MKRPSPDSPEFEQWMLQRAKARSERLFGADRPKPGTPEFEAWLLAKAQKWSVELFTAEIPADLADVGSGLIAGPRSWEDVMPEKTIAEDIAIDKAHKRMHLKSVK
jgi:hypothetical protein